MKTQEEKAKAYDEALEKAKKLYEKGTITESLNYVFPELAESEDEKIRKWLIGYFNQYIIDGMPQVFGNGLNVKDVISWLEKQGASYTKEDIDDAYLKGISDAKNEIEKQHEANYQIRKDIATFIFNYRGDIKDRAKWMNYLDVKVSFVEKQDNQKSQGKSALEALKEEKVDNANKVEQSFTWNEEDEKNLKRAIWYVEHSAINVVKDTMLSEWLKSIKERIDYKKKLIDIIDKAAEWWLIHDSYSKNTNNLVNDFKKDLLKYVDTSE